MKRFGAVFVCAMLLAANAAIAQTVPSIQSSVIVVNSDEIFDRTVFGQRIQAEQTAQENALRAENQDIEQSLNEEEIALTKRRKETTAEEFQVLASEFDAKVKSIKETQDKKGNDLLVSRTNARIDFYRAITPLIDEIMRTYGATIVIDKTNAFIFDNRIDITEQAIQLIDQRFGDGRQKN